MSKLPKVFACGGVMRPSIGGCTLFVAASSRKKAMEFMGVSAGHFRMYGHLTGNKDDVDLCIASPGVVFSQSYKPGFNCL